MNGEFIVWDEDNECFIDETKCVFVDGNLYRNTNCFLNCLSEDLTMFHYIGLWDSTDRKIYADCSIVEFLGSDGSVYAKGYFSYDNKRLAYKVFDLDDNVFYKYSDFIAFNVRIIDNIQENKLGLMK